MGFPLTLIVSLRCFSNPCCSGYVSDHKATHRLRMLRIVKEKKSVCTVPCCANNEGEDAREYEVRYDGDCRMRETIGSLHQREQRVPFICRINQ